MRSDDNSALGWAAIDFLSCLLLVVLTAIAPTPRPPSIDTYGAFAVTIQWPAASTDDVDVYVEDPDGQIAYFANADAGLMHLEHDDLGVANDTEGAATLRHNGERVVLRGFVPGEYVVNVHMYAKNQPGPTPVEVGLFALRGDDRELTHRTVTLNEHGDEVTAFRFTLNGAGDVTDLNRLPRQLVGNAKVASPQP